VPELEKCDCASDDFEQRIGQREEFTVKTKLLALILTLSMALALCACSASAVIGEESSQSASSTGENSTPEPSAGEVSSQAAAAGETGVQAQYPAPPADWEEQLKRLEENPVEDSFLEALNRFALRTGGELLKEEGGCCSPLSLYYALALAAEGADGATAQELYALLGAERPELAGQCSNLFRRLYTEDEEGSLLLANSLWMDEEVQGEPVHFREEYLNGAAEQFYASLFTVDFSDPGTGQKIGDWVYENTHEKLRFEPEPNEAQLLAIVNTVYFNSPWSKPFEKGLTKDAVFTCGDGSEQTVPFLHTTETDRYYKGEGYGFASLPLRRGRMNFYLPDEGVDVHSLLEQENLLKTPDWGENGDKLWEIHWSVPKFIQESKWSAVEALRALGVQAAFSDGADFSRISDAPAKITAIEQGTRIGVDEEGVEAAAYTAIGLEAAGIAPEELEVVEMNLNRPFLYTVTSQDGVVLFMGICDSVA
jgi:serpin B